MRKQMINFVGSAILLGMLLLSISTSPRADDIDIYVASGASATSEPMVMFVIDWRPNLASTICNSFSSGDSDATIAAACGWQSSFVSYFTAADKADNKIIYFELLRAVLKQVMASLSGIKVGLMINHDNNCTGGTTAGPAKTGCSNGAYVMSGFKSLDSTDANGNKAAFHAKLAAIPEPQGAASHKFQGKEVYFELFRYLTGQGIYNGHLGWKDYANTDNSDNLNGAETPNYNAISWDTAIESGTNYVTPIAATADCAKIFAINILFQVTQQEGDSDSAITAAKGLGGMNSLVLSGSSNKFETVLSWMYNNDLADGTYGTAPNVTGKQNVTSYFLVDSPNTSTNSYANAGGTTAAIGLGTDPAAMATKISNVFNQILSVSTTFVAASVPVNVFNRTEFLDDVYIALFEAEKNGKPKWVGDLKKLKIQQDAFGQYYIGDVSGNAAFSSDSRINYSALTYWTNPAGADVVAADTTVGEISGYDGRSVDRGGAGQQINGFLSGSPGINNSDSGARKLFTEPSSYANGTAATLLALDATSANASTLWTNLNANGVYSSGATLNATTWSSALTYATAVAADQTEAVNLLKFARGIDVTDEDADGSTTDTRPWLLADPIHSRPLAINYGATSGYSLTNPDIRIFMGGNDGFMHMFNNTTTSATQSGKEGWAFMPRYAMNILKRLKDNAPGTPIHPYGVDGEAVVYVLDVNKDGTINQADGDKAYLYFGMRRGGKLYYALDVTVPDSPKMLWSISNSAADFNELGLTFSTPRLAKLNYDSNIKKPVLIFAAGYDTNKDTRNASTGTDDTKGRGIYIINAETGALIWKAVRGSSTGNISSTEYHHADLFDSIPSQVTIMDSDGNGAVDRFYVGDTGGVIWRADLAGTNRTAWVLTKFASLGRHYNSAKEHDRRFFHAVDVVQYRDSSGDYDAVIVGSGDRPNPLDKSIGTTVPENWMYMLKDRATSSGTPSATTLLHSDLADLSNNCFQEISLTCTTTQITALGKGWRIELNQGGGEKALSAPLTLGGIIYFTTYQPPDTSGSTTCGPSEGTGLLYALNLKDASAALNFDQSNSVTNMAGDVIELQAGDRFRYTGAGIPADAIIISKGGKNIIVVPGGLLEGPAKPPRRTYWYQTKQ